jgi:hypothetical protein
MNPMASKWFGYPPREGTIRMTQTTDPGKYEQGEITNPRMLGVCAKLYEKPRVAPYPPDSLEWHEWLEGYDEAEVKEVSQ